MSLWELIWMIFYFNALTLGNGPAMIPLLQESLVDQRMVLTIDQLLYAFAIARVTPGQANVYVASVGYFLFGMLGAVLATLVVQLPGYLMLPLMRGYEQLSRSGWVKNIIRGLTTASVGLIFAATWNIGQRTLNNWIAWAVFLAVLAMTYLLRWNIMLSLLLASLLGIALKLLLGA